MHLSPRTRAWATLVGAVVVVLLAVLVSQLGGLSGSSPSGVSTATVRASVVASSATGPGGAPVLVPTSGNDPSLSAVPWVAQSALDAQARTTLVLVQTGGPFPYPRNDGVTYHNANRQLPPQGDGYYREYTVPTPGSSSRGARRIIAGRGGDFYYTRDHYDSFHRIHLGT
ncbi:MAG: ribonuclease N [Actinomycetota bacterium]|nr:ribonuclease N [Actinomycetota bacterium]